ncbi:hypothetical protein [Burkholderia sp.]|uniref:hypothetical protein n=1 Tax=Burkholderia sp. TaxID=36773 RepID=UPI0025C6BE95|nr:hypothetical protein [Burkholderia sp.]MBS6361054.1 hypothetical protein [Burkholderia sp.]
MMEILLFEWNAASLAGETGRRSASGRHARAPSADDGCARTACAHRATFDRRGATRFSRMPGFHTILQVPRDVPSLRT